MKFTAELACVGLSGGIGAILRVYASAALESRARDLGWGGVLGGHAGTLAINLLGCLLVGLLSAKLPQQWRVVVIGGFLGGFTTFGTFGALLFEHGQQARWAVLTLQFFGHVVGGVAAVWAGRSLSRMLWLG